MRKVFLCLILVGFAVSLDAADTPADTFRWENITDHGKGDYARAVAISGSTAIAAELLQTADNGLDFTVKAFDIATGQLRWEDAVPASPGIVTEVYLATLGDSVFALGYVPGPGGPFISADMFLRAYRVSTGNTLWTHIWDAGQDDFPKGITVANGRVTIVGYGGNAQPGENVHGLVRTLDATNGSVLWTSIINKSGTMDAVFGVATDGIRVITAGLTDVGTRRDLNLRSYDAQTGVPIWEAGRQATAGMVQLRGNRVFVAGYDTLSGGANTFLAAFDVSTGDIVWQTPAIAGNFTTLAVNETQVVAVGSPGVQSVNPVNGAVRWFDPAPCCTGYREGFGRLALTANAVYAVGSAGQDFIYQEMLLRIYGRDGAVLVEERAHQVNGNSSVYMALAVDGQRLVTAGYMRATTDDAVVRGYDVSAIEPGFTVGPVDRRAAPIAFRRLILARERR